MSGRERDTGPDGALNSETRVVSALAGAASPPGRTVANPPHGVNRRPVLLTGARGRRYDSTVASTLPPPPRRPRCPTCRAATAWAGNPQRPFCSLSCRLIDLGGWLDERYRIEGPMLSSETDSHTDQEDAVPKGSG